MVMQLDVLLALIVSACGSSVLRPGASILLTRMIRIFALLCFFRGLIKADTVVWILFCLSEQNTFLSYVSLRIGNDNSDYINSLRKFLNDHSCSNNVEDVRV